jgi:membrane protease YdiL (CAAX protease family)
MLVYVSCFVVWALIFSIGVQGRMSHPSAIMDADRAELMLKLGTSFYILEKHIGARGSGGVFGTKPGGHTAPQKQFLLEGKKVLEDSLNENPDSANLIAKLAIVLFDLGDEDSRKEGLFLLKQLLGRTAAVDRDLGKALLEIYTESTVDAGKESAFQKTIEDSIQPGWYRDASLLRLYKVCRDKQKYDRLHDDIEQRAAGSLINTIYLVVIGAVVILLGFVVIIVQLFLWPGRKSSGSDQYWHDLPSWSPRTVYLVFIAWLAMEIAGGAIVQRLLKESGIAQLGQMGVAITTALTYFASNAPALFFIYWFACRPVKAKLTDSISLKLKSGKHGTLWLVFIGLATWCAAVPIVALACYLGSKFLGAQGSSNPIIALVLSAARSANSGAILLFYLTLGVLAPLCEESLFRGFLYSSLRRRFGVGVSAFASAALFASAHLDPGAVIPLLSLGLIFAFVFERTKSLVPSMIAHGLWNSGSFTVMLMVFGN